MPLSFDVTESKGFALHDADEWYPGILVDIEDEPDGPYGASVKFVIELDDDEPDKDGNPRSVWAYASQSATTKSKLYGWYVAITGKELEIGETLDLRRLLPKPKGTASAPVPVDVMFAHYKKADPETGDPVKKEKVVKIRGRKGARSLREMQESAKVATKPRVPFVDPPDAEPF